MKVKEVFKSVDTNLPYPIPGEASGRGALRTAHVLDVYPSIVSLLRRLFDRR